MDAGAAEARLDQEGPELVAVEPDRVGLVVDARPPDVDRKRVVDEALASA